MRNCKSPDWQIEPWPSKYQMGMELKPAHIQAYRGRTAGAFESTIPPCTVEPPQVHITAQRDGMPFQELLIPENKPLWVIFFDVKTKRFHPTRYEPGAKASIPAFRIHWLANPGADPLRFVCEYAPHPWDGDRDEPEFRDLAYLLRFAKEKGFYDKIR